MGAFLMVVSPSKSLSEIKNNNCKTFTQPKHIDKSVQIVDELKAVSVGDLGVLMRISPKLAELNWVRYQKWSAPFNPKNSRQAILSFSGDVYEGLKSNDFGVDDFVYAQNYLRILSGLYGLLSPLDLIQPYRLEMGSAFMLQGKQSLYSFWSQLITNDLNLELGTEGVLINLASNEYFKAIDLKQLKSKVIHIEFRENKPDGLKVIPILSKKARGLMARFADKSKITDVESLKLFDYEGYMFSEPLSSNNKWVFIR